MKFFTTVFVGALVLSTSAFAEDVCTPEVITAKTEEMNAAVTTIAASNPEKLEQLLTEFQTSFQTAAMNEDEQAVCAAFDALLAGAREE